MHSVVRSRTFTTTPFAIRLKTNGQSVLAGLMLSCVGLSSVGCGSKRSESAGADADAYSVSMPLAATSIGPEDISFVAQPQSGRREVIPTPPGKPVVKGELVPAPAGEPEMAEPSGESVSANEATGKSIQGANAEAPASWETWPTPQTVLFLTGNQHGYIEPCGCTGLENQKGGFARRYTLMTQLTEKGWPLVPIDAGNQVRLTGRQSEIKFQAAATGLAEMNYAAVGFGPDDLRLGVGELIAVAAVDDAEQARFVSANVVLIDPTLMPQGKVIESGGRRIGVTSVLDPAALERQQDGEITVDPINEKLSEALAHLQAKQSDFNVLTFFGEEEAAENAVRDVKGFDLVVVAGGYGEPMFEPQTIEGTATKMIVTGNKGMYVGLVGLYADSPYRYARVPLTSAFPDAPEMRRLMASYQSQLESLGLSGLGLKPIAHPSGDKFVGTKVCGECHTNALEVWEGSDHALATEHIVHPGERSDISRHFDPECISCHVTGWNAQNYYPYETGYLSLDISSHLTGNGCENCHGPGARHSDAEREDSGVELAIRDELRVAMRLPLDKAKERCMECHDLDNSPDFHKEDAFDEFWSEVEHYGVE